MGCRDVAQVDVHLDGEGAPHVVDVRPSVRVSEGSPLRIGADNSDRGFDGVVTEIATLACRRAHVMEEEQAEAEAAAPEAETEAAAEAETETAAEAETETAAEAETAAETEAAASGAGAGDAHR
jgi:hypothetical protein